VTSIPPELWARLDHARPTGNRIAAAKPAQDVERLLCALDDAGGRHLLVLLRDDEVAYRDRESRGLTIESRELRIIGEESKRYLDIECLDSAGFAALDIMASEIAEGLRIIGSTAPPHDAVRRVLSKWRRFWGHLPRTLLTRDEQVGLFAEIWFLLFWLIPRVGIQNSARRWRGPFGARHDFEWRETSVEVKGTTSSRGRVHVINGLDQLTVPENGALYLFSMRFREEASATNSLPTLIQATKVALAGNGEAMDCLDEALARSGYSSTHEDDYAKVRFRIIDQHLYAVRDNFPKVSVSSFKNILPPQIEGVQYMLNLVGVDEFCIARIPSDASTDWWV
jgi:hypothetical protein